MKEKKDILNNLKRSDKPSVPEGFFESFSDKLMSNLLLHANGKCFIYACFQYFFLRNRHIYE